MSGRPGTVLLDGATLDRLDALSVATARTPAELVRLALAEFSIDVETSSADAVDPGQGTAASTPAPTNAPKMLQTAPATFVCISDPCWGQRRPAAWCKPGGEDACCDDHIPDGWVRPDETAAPDTQAPTDAGGAMADGHEDGASAAGASSGSAPAKPTVAAAYTDPDGDRLTLLALHGRPADWSLVLTTTDGFERDVLVEDDETLAGFARMLLGAIEDRPR